MSSWNRDLDEWIRGVFQWENWITNIRKRSWGGFSGGDVPRQFDEMRQQMERMFKE